jgi:pimeloyl-ACP methyl ester carboxylesterase
MQNWNMERVPEERYSLPGVRRIDYQSRVDGHLDWALVRPPDAGGIWLVCLHGHGSHGDQLYARRDIREFWLSRFLAHGLGVLTPNLRDNAWMGPAAVADLDALLELVRNEFGARQFVFASGSMGGTGNLIYAAVRPQNVAGVLARGAACDLASYHAWCVERRDERPILGEIADAIVDSYGGTPADVPEIYERHSALSRSERLSMPLFLAHGAADATTPVGQMRRLVGRLPSHPALTYVEIPDGNHDSPLHLETVPSPLAWLLEKLSPR